MSVPAPISGGGSGSGSHGRKRHCHRSSRSSRSRHSGTSIPASIAGLVPGLSAASSSTPKSPASLLDICAKRVAEFVPFAAIESRYDRIPEPVQERVIFWSFPRNERDICMYSSLARVPASTQEYHNSPFYRGIKLLEQNCVQDVLQVGKTHKYHVCRRRPSPKKHQSVTELK